jgi:hypothetical protein
MRFWTELRLSKLGLVVALACAAALGFMIFNTAFSKGAGITGKVVLALVGIGATLATLLANPAFTFRPASYKALMTRSNIAGLILALWFGINAMTGVLGLLSPSGVVESKPLKIEKDVGDVKKMIDQRLPAQPTRAPVLDQLPGSWGEAGCAVTWRMSIEGNAMTAELTRRPAGVGPYKLVASIVKAEGMTLAVSGESPDSAKGMAANFGLDTSGATPKLSWADRARDVPLVLMPCDEVVK